MMMTAMMLMMMTIMMIIMLLVVMMIMMLMQMLTLVVRVVDRMIGQWVVWMVLVQVLDTLGSRSVVEPGRRPAISRVERVLGLSVDPTLGLRGICVNPALGMRAHSFCCYPYLHPTTQSLCLQPHNGLV